MGDEFRQNLSLAVETSNLRPKLESPAIAQLIYTAVSSKFTESRVTLEDNISHLMEGVLSASAAVAGSALFGISDTADVLNTPGPSNERSNPERVARRQRRQYVIILRRWFETVASRVPVTRADRILRPSEYLMSQAAKLGSDEETREKLTDPLACMEWKNVIAADPRVYLCVVLLVAICSRGSLFPWPDEECGGCESFHWAHNEEFMTKHLESIGFGNGLAHPPTSDVDIQKAINDVMSFMTVWDAENGQWRQHKYKQKLMRRMTPWIKKPPRMKKSPQTEKKLPRMTIVRTNPH